MKKTIIFSILSLLTLALVAQTPPRVSLRLSQDTIMIGDQITLLVEIDKDVAHDIKVPEFKEGKLMDKVEIIGEPRLDTISSEGRAIKLKLEYTITSFDAGIYSLKDFPIVVGVDPRFDTIRSTDSTLLVVQTFEIDTTKQQIFDIKRPMDTPVTWQEIQPYFWWGLLGLVVLAAIIYGLIWYLRRRKEIIANRPKDPLHVVALRELEKLHSQKLWQSGKAKEYFSELTEILREYIEKRYGIEAMEMTSAEILAAIGQENDEKLIQILRELFSLSDLVKFAKLTPDGTECETAYFDAYYYVENTKEIVIEEKEDEQKNE